MMGPSGPRVVVAAFGHAFGVRVLRVVVSPFGHALMGVRVDGPSARRFFRFLGLTAAYSR